MKMQLKDGFEVSVSEECFNDWKFLTMLRKIDKGDTGLIVDIAESILGGEEEVDKLAKHLEVDGVTPADSMIGAIAELLEAISELKNSQSSPA